jgi:hypothetical protein
MRLRPLLLSMVLVLMAPIGHASDSSSSTTIVKNTLTYQQFDQLRMATGGELILRDNQGQCLRVVVKAPKAPAPGKTVPDPNFDTDPLYACAIDGTPAAATVKG